MGEFDDLDPSEITKAVDEQRADLQQETVEAVRKERDEAERRAAERAASLAEADSRTDELFAFLRKAFHGRKMSINQELVVERTGSRPDGIGLSRSFVPKLSV